MKKMYRILIGFAVMTLPQIALAAEGGAHASGGRGFAAIASGLCIALAAMAGAIGQGRVAATALDGIARNPGAAGKMFVPMIIGLVLIESLVIYSFVISFLLLKG